MPRGKQSGFTLIELMITVAIIAIIAAIAYPSYQKYVIKSHRTNAKAQMLDIANRQQQYLLANRAYASSLTALNYTLPSDVSPRYTAAIAASAAGETPSFTITFQATGSQLSDGGLTLNSAGTKGCTDSAGAVTTANCTSGTTAKW
jgi:type IV pilus assembly protein PilE